jgi:hypothetical protein
MAHGMVDYCNTPRNIQCGNFNSDNYPDIARFTGSKLEIFLFMGRGYMREPQQTRTFSKQIESLGLDDFLWDGIDNLEVTFTNGTTETFHHKRGYLDLENRVGVHEKAEVPRTVNEADFEIVWESEPYAYGMHRCTVGDLDNDGINEFVTWWKESYYDSSGWILIYKSIGNDEYELFMEEPFYTIEAYHPYLTYLMIADIDQNGFNELIFTRMYTYFWEFTAPGIYQTWRSDFNFPRAVQDVRISDVDQDGIMEIAAVTSNPGVPPPTAYIVQEFHHKSEADSMIYFNGITGFYQDWSDMRFDVGDFDNDGVVDMVSGNFGWVSGQPINIQYYRYDPGALNNFSQNWLYTGLPANCAVPIIEDIDGDGLNELFAVGIIPGNGSAFIYEGTGYGVGSVSWVDSTNLPEAPTEGCFGYVDAQPSVLSLGFSISPGPHVVLSMWAYQNNNFEYVWESGDIDSSGYVNPHLFDIDNDGKTNILVADDSREKLVDWEQTSAGISKWSELEPSKITAFRSVYPNPFNNSTNISFTLQKTSNIQLNLLNSSGQEIFNLCQRRLEHGQHEIQISNDGYSSGVYFISLSIGDKLHIRRVVLLK